MPVSAKVASRISTELKRYQAILSNAKQRDIGEADTVTIITDMLSDVFGYDKYRHVTSEHSVRGAYVDLAVIVDNEPQFLIEAKAIGIDLKDGHVRQAVDYAANKGTEWVVLTNGAIWRVYKIKFTQPIEKSLAFELDVMAINPKSLDVLECFGNLCREGFSKDAMSELWQQKQVTSKFAVAALLLSETMLDELRKEIRRLSPGLKIEPEYLRSLLEDEVIKRDLVDGEDAKEATAIIKKLKNGITRQKRKKSGDDTSDEGDEIPTQNTVEKQEVPDKIPLVAASPSGTSNA